MSQTTRAAASTSRNKRVVITYEEYFPYGATAWWAEKSGIQVSAKRYRYTGMEKDEETGLSYHSARYYATWLGRWCSADPIGLGDGGNRWAYVGGDPTNSADLSGCWKNDIDLAPFRERLDSPKPEHHGQDYIDAFRIGSAQGEFFGNVEVFLSALSEVQANGQTAWEMMSTEDRQTAFRAILDRYGKLPEEDAGRASTSAEYSLGLERGKRFGVQAALHKQELWSMGWGGVAGAGLMALGGLSASRSPRTVASPLSAALLGTIKTEQLNADLAVKLIRAQGGTATSAETLLAASPKLVGEASRARIFLGPYQQAGVITEGQRIATVGNTGKRILENWQRRIGGRILDYLPGEMQYMIPEIQAAEEIVFNVSASGLVRNPLTAEEFIYILSRPELVNKTRFVVGATY